MKECSKCKEVKELDEFHQNRSAKDGRTSSCKECRNAYNNKKSAEIGHDVLYRRARDRNPEKYKARAARYYAKNSDAAKERASKWRKNNPELKKQLGISHYQNNRQSYIDNAAEWARSNPERRKEIASSYARRFYNNPENKPIIAARKLISRVVELTGERAETRTESALGYSVHDLKNHLEFHFQDGMTWDNHGEWHIDHVIPVSEMVRLGVTCPKRINALKNLRPVWAHENLSKGDRFSLTQPMINV